MSHTTWIKDAYINVLGFPNLWQVPLSRTVREYLFKDGNASVILAAAEQLKLPYLGEKEYRMPLGDMILGHGFALPGWRAPVVFSMEHRCVFYDNYNGYFGKQLELDRLIQVFEAECFMKQLAAHGQAATYKYEENGDFVVTIKQ